MRAAPAFSCVIGYQHVKCSNAEYASASRRRRPPSVAGAHVLVLPRHLEGLVDEAAEGRELVAVELADVEPPHLAVEAPSVPLDRRQPEDEVEEEADRAPRLEQREERDVRAPLQEEGRAADGGEVRLVVVVEVSAAVVHLHHHLP